MNYFELRRRALDGCAGTVKSFGGSDTVILQHNELRDFANRRRKMVCGVYLWHENFHGDNKLLYIGASENLYGRLLRHLCAGSPIGDYIADRMNQAPRRCRNYGATCDCFPRFYVEIVAGTGGELYALERELIERHAPPLNIQYLKATEG